MGASDSLIANCSHAGVGVVSVVFAFSSVALVDVVVHFENFPWAPRTNVFGAGHSWLLLLSRGARLALLGTAAVCGIGGGGGGMESVCGNKISKCLMLPPGSSHVSPSSLIASSHNVGCFARPPLTAAAADVRFPHCLR